MKKQTRIGLMALVTVALLLALAVPVLAGESSGRLFKECYVAPPYWWKGDIYTGLNVWGDLDWYEIEGGLVNECIGVIPLGETVNNTQFTFLSFDELCTETQGTCLDGVYSFYNDTTELRVVDPIKKEVYRTPNWLFTVDEDGNFSLMKTYYFPE